MIFPQKKVFHTKNVENVENYVEKNAKKLDFALVGKKSQSGFPQFRKYWCGKVENFAFCARCTILPFKAKNCIKMTDNKWRNF